MKKAAIILLSIVSICILAYFLLDSEDVQVDAEYALSTGGDVLEFNGLYTSYTDIGDNDADVILMVHGFSVPSIDWIMQINFFAQAGFRVIAYDHYGRGYSSNEGLPFDRDMYIGQIKDLLDGTGISKPVYIMGHSMGGALASEFAVRYPEKVKGLVLNSPMLNPSKNNGVVQFLKIPVIGDFAARIIMKPSLQSRADGLFLQMPEEYSGPLFSEMFSRQMRVIGFERAVLQLFRNGAFDDYSDTYTKLGQLDIPVQMIFGTADKSVTQEDFAFIRNAVKPVTYEIVEDGSHSLNLEKPDFYNAAVLRFLSQS